ncbi:tRNA 2-selenouridine(34) synthase MnmH [Actibacterium pelagium]|nr:tRNA 2-selenouridine(34) synthase MnmH [Actibacterium pelagium]
MSFPLPPLADLPDLPFDEIIDVRSPAEFAEDHLPGAVSMPVMSNEERAEIGTIYVQDSPFTARKKGAAVVARNAARHLETLLADKPKGYRPLVYCWRGGQRSGSFAVILRQIGWQAEVVEDGYRAYRRLVQQAMYDAPCPFPVVVLAGDTGTAKTAILAELKRQGTQVLDLEGLANHRGSIFGAMPEGQPAQKGFESALAAQMAAMDPVRPVVVEAESNKVGDIRLPPAIWHAMMKAPRIEVAAPVEARATYLTRTYTDTLPNTDGVVALIQSLSDLHPKDRIAGWVELAQKTEWQELSQELMLHHYDPRYARTSRRNPAPETRLDLSDLSDATLRDTAGQIADLVAKMG